MQIGGSGLVVQVQLAFDMVQVLGHHGDGLLRITGLDSLQQGVVLVKGAVRLMADFVLGDDQLGL